MPGRNKQGLSNTKDGYELPGMSPMFPSPPSSPFHSMNDRDLWHEFKNGNRSAFIHIYNRYFDELYLYGTQFTRDTDLLKDCIQDVFVRLNESKKRLTGTSSIKYYLYKSIKREIIHTLKRQKYAIRKLEVMKGRGFEYEISAEEIMISRQINEDMTRSLREAANNLIHRQREIIFYHFFEGFSIKQIQELMGFNSVQATHNLLNRALKKLKEVLHLIPLLLLTWW